MPVARRARILAFGSAAGLVVAGVMCRDLTGEALAIALVSVGLDAALLLVFLEVGLSEDRQRTRDEESRRRGQAGASSLDGGRRSAAGHLAECDGFGLLLCASSREVAERR
jgi:hypothetical protein